MTTSTEAPPTEEATSDGPTWSQMPELPEPSEATPVQLVAKQLVLGLALSALLWVLGRHTAAIVVLVASALFAVVSLLSKRMATILGRFAVTLQRVVGKGLSYLLLGLIEIFVFTPVAAISWLIRRDPLAMGRERSAPTQWRENVANGRRELHTHQFTYEWPVRAHRRSLLGILASVLGAIVILMACDLGVGLAVSAVQGTPQPTGTPLFSTKIAAIPRTPWWPSVLADTFNIATTARPDPFLGWTFNPEFHDTYTNIDGGVRRSFEPPVPPGRKPVEVLFLGGSTLAGSYQRDDRTIPSDIARLAATNGIPIHVTNRAAQGYSVWQELNLLEELLGTGYRPNVVVLYDGINELYVQAAVGTTSQPSHIKARSYDTAIFQYERQLASGTNTNFFSQAYHDYTNTSAIARAVRTITGQPSTASPEVNNILWDSDQSSSTAVTRGVDAATIHNEAVSVFEALAAHFGFRLVPFWQPFLYSKTPLAAERNVPGLWGESPTAWRTMDAVARTHLAPPVIDISTALNGSKVPVMIDFMHTNELGAQEVADAMYPHLVPSLEAGTTGTGR